MPKRPPVNSLSTSYAKSSGTGQGFIGTLPSRIKSIEWSIDHGDTELAKLELSQLLADVLRTRDALEKMDRERHDFIMARNQATIDELQKGEPS